MNEGETSVPAQDQTPRKSGRTATIVMIAVLLGFVALIALNMR